MDNEKKFRAALAFVLRHEGGYVNDPDDPGGETKYGISKRAHPDLDIKNLTETQAGEIYRRAYWDACGLDIFDAAVNLGPLQAKKLAQKAAGAAADGIWGPKTRAAFAARTDEALVEMLCHYRRQCYQDIVRRRPASQKYLKGWLRRVDDLQQYVRTL